MKHLYLIVILCLLSSCAPSITHFGPVTNYSVFDFTSYSEKGFLITPHEYQAPYDAIGMVEVSYSPEALFPQNIEGGLIQQSPWIISPIDANMVLNLLYQKASGMGADAIMDFTIEYQKINPAIGLNLPVLKLSGFAIKRK